RATPRAKRASASSSRRATRAGRGGSRSWCAGSRCSRPKTRLTAATTSPKVRSSKEGAHAHGSRRQSPLAEDAAQDSPAQVEGPYQGASRPRRRRARHHQGLGPLEVQEVLEVTEQIFHREIGRSRGQKILLCPPDLPTS